MKLVAAAAVLGLAACYRPHGETSCEVSCDVAFEHPCPNAWSCESGVCRDPAGPACGVVDAPPLTGDVGSGCYGGDLVTICPSVVPTGTRTVDDTSEPDTTVAGPFCTEIVRVGTSSICVVEGKDVEIIGDLRLTGANPVAFLATGTLTLTSAGYLDASSYLDGGHGAGQGIGCAAPRDGASSSSNGAGAGGSGGTFGGLGGSGGAGLTTPPTPPLTVVPVVQLASGCPGGAGGKGMGNGAGPSVAGGLGGGALIFLAGTKIVVDGIIVVNGAGGSGGTIEGGGGGGGSGGLIDFEAPMITGTAMLVSATGGGGGGGGDQGRAGSDGHQAMGIAPAMGGAATTGGGGQGGKGPAFTNATDTDGQSGSHVTQAGGGGGGGAGVIHTHGTVTITGTIRGARTP